MKEKNITIENCWVCSVHGSDIIPAFGDILINNNIIIKIRLKDFQLYRKNPGKVHKNSYNAFGRVVTLPLVNFHDHIYSRLAKGLPLSGKFNNFMDILHNLWWKLDKSLDHEMIAASAKMAAIESIRNGVTYIFDHHSSQNHIEESLGVIQNALNKFGLRAVLCFECTDRNGFADALKGLEENKNYAASISEGDFRAMLGLHASFTLSDDTLTEAAAIIKKNLDLGIHIHVAEDKADVDLSMKYTGYRPTKRLARFNLLNDKSILVHGVNLKKKDFPFIIDNAAALAFCFDSNMNNHVGIPDFNLIPQDIPFLIGTDGMHANIARSLRHAHLAARHQGFSFEQAANLIKKIYFDQLTFVRRYFPDFPSLIHEERADFIIWDYVPPTPLDKDNFWGHFIYGILEYPVNSVVHNGEFLMKNFQMLNCDENTIKNEILIQGERVVKEISKLNIN